MKKKKNKSSTSFDEIKPIKGFHAVKFFRKVKKRISKKLAKMSDKEFTEYLNSPGTIHDLLKK